MRPTWLRQRETIQKRSLIPVAGCSLGRIMRLPTGAGTRRGPRHACLRCLVAVILPKGCTMLLLVVVISDQTAASTVSCEPDPLGRTTVSYEWAPAAAVDPWPTLGSGAAPAPAPGSSEP
jgi:hypothetical protein